MESGPRMEIWLLDAKICCAGIHRVSVNWLSGLRVMG